ncbi:MAG: zinc ribbon domain-containing protein [Melioribacteraceae bacterium]|nr:zinc ribbon domain-containing protein [Melioribacteraceae bacterium]
MPTYDYKCTKCNKSFEYFQKMSDDLLTVCENCGGDLKRLIGSGLTPIFKGNGFYQTDYKNNGNSKKGTESKTKQKSTNNENKKTENKVQKKSA